MASGDQEEVSSKLYPPRSACFSTRRYVAVYIHTLTTHTQLKQHKQLSNNKNNIFFLKKIYFLMSVYDTVVMSTRRYREAYASLRRYHIIALLYRYYCTAY